MFKSQKNRSHAGPSKKKQINLFLIDRSDIYFKPSVDSNIVHQPYAVAVYLYYILYVIITFVATLDAAEMTQSDNFVRIDYCFNDFNRTLLQPHLIISLFSNNNIHYVVGIVYGISV